MKFKSALFVLLFVLYGWCSQALAQPKEQRVALVIGNSAYKSSPLKNPVNDATDMAQALREKGFVVTLKTNVGTKDMRQAIRAFSQSLKAGGVGLFYFAGHGIQSKGRNYLIPLSAEIKEEFELEDEAVDANRVLAGMEEAGNRVNIVILDACRDNPFARAWRSSTSGLAQLSAPIGSFVAFATAPGSVAADGVGRNGVFTQHLLTSLKHPDSDIDKVFTRVAAAVARDSANKQVPWKSSSLTGEFLFSGTTSQTASSATPSAPNLSEAQKEEKFWDDAKSAGNKDAFEAYLSLYPSGRYVGLAKANLAKLVPPAPIAQPFLSPRDVLAGAYVGTWSPEQCGSKTTYVNRLENESLLGEFRGNGNLISTSVIRLDTVKYLGSFNGMHRVAYRVTSENASNKVQTVNDLTIETDFKIRRTVDSTRGNVQLIKDGVVLSSNQKVVDIVKCN